MMGVHNDSTRAQRLDVWKALQLPMKSFDTMESKNPLSNLLDSRIRHKSASRTVS